jgi:hypothetical protein
VERLWNAFGDNLTAKRRSMGNGRLAELVYCRMNMLLVPNEYLSDAANHFFDKLSTIIQKMIKHTLLPIINIKLFHTCAGLNS